MLRGYALRIHAQSHDHESGLWLAESDTTGLECMLFFCTANWPKGPGSATWIVAKLEYPHGATTHFAPTSSHPAESARSIVKRQGKRARKIEFCCAVLSFAFGPAEKNKKWVGR